MQQHPLRSFRESRSPPLSQDELASLLGVTKAAISRWETGERFPERDLWSKIREITGVGIEELSTAVAGVDQ